MEIVIFSVVIGFMTGMFVGERSRTFYYKTLFSSYKKKIDNTKSLSISSKEIAKGVLTELEKFK